MRRNVAPAALMTQLTRLASVATVSRPAIRGLPIQGLSLLSRASRFALRDRRLPLIAVVCGLLATLCGTALAADGSAREPELHDSTHFVVPAPVATVPPTPVATETPEPAIALAMRTLETGVAFPRWSTGGYGASDDGWQSGLDEITQQTDAGWVEMMIQLYQDTQSSTYIHQGPWTPTPESLADGIRAAHRTGLRVFVVPLLGVLRGQPWGGAIHFASYAQARAWFASYWNALEPYMQAAAETGAEQFAIGTELSALESADASLWHTLIASAHATFPGKLTYDMNWSTLGYEPRGWMSDPLLTYLGVSEYAPIAAGPWALSTDQIAAVWQQRILPGLDRLSAAAGKPVILSEIGYRDSHDALYRPWDHSSRARQDPNVQAAAYEAALRTVYMEPAIAGIFFWAWSVDAFAPNNLPAAQVLRTYYGYYAYRAWLAAQGGIRGRHAG